LAENLRKEEGGVDQEVEEEGKEERRDKAK